MDSSTAPPVNAINMQSTAPANSSVNDPSIDPTTKQTSSGVSSWGWNLKIPQPFTRGQDESPTENSAKSPFARFTSALTLRSSPRDQTPDQGTEPDADGASSASNFFGNLTKGLVDSSKTAVRAVQLKARHVVSQNKRRYQEDGYDLDMTYITENIIAMGFPAGDMSSGFFGYVEGLYRNQMEEVISFLENHHKGKYKVYNLCSERLYDASLFEGKVASFPFDDHNCPPLHLITSFCQSAYSWLKEDIENVVVVHCKAGMARTGLMISSLLLYLKFFPTAEESIDHYNLKRCFDGKGLVLPSQIRYVKYFERVLMYFNGENQPGRRCMLRGFRLHRCPYWIRPHITVSDHNGVLFSTKKHPRTKDMTPEDFWFTAPKKGIIVFAMPGDPGLTELAGDFKVHFHDGQGDFYFWLNTTMIENRMILNTGDMDGFDKRKLPSPGFQVEVVLVELNDTPTPTPPQPATATQTSTDSPIAPSTVSVNATSSSPSSNHDSRPEPQPKSQDKDDVFSDDEGDKSDTKTSQKAHTTSADTTTKSTSPPQINTSSDSKVEEIVTCQVEKTSLGDDNKRESTSDAPSSTQSEFKIMAADASVFTFGDDDDYESD